MADNAAGAAVSPQKRRRTVWLWLAVMAALAIGFTLLLRLYPLDKADVSRRVVEACVQNMPAVPQWEADLARHGLSGQEGRIIEPYCRCLWEEPIRQLSDQDIRSLPNLTPQQQLDKLGGSKAFLQRQERCLMLQKQ